MAGFSHTGNKSARTLTIKYHNHYVGTVIQIDTLSMASNKFDYKFVTEPDDSLKCSICLEVVVNPEKEIECGKLYCNECIRKNGEKPCPTCRTDSPKFFSDKKSKANLNSV